MSQSIIQIGSWSGEVAPLFEASELASAAHRMREPTYVVREPSTGRVGVAFGGHTAPSGSGLPLLACLPALYPEWLGDRSFLEAHGVRFPYVAGAMANGIATTELVIAMAQAQMLGFFGAGGLSFQRVEEAIATIQAAVAPGQAWGANLIHSPNEPELEAAVADLYIRTGVPRVSASAYMRLTAPLVRYSASGLFVGQDGQVARRHHVFAKVSRPETASAFMAPAPEEILNGLVEAGQLTAEQARLAATVPVAEDYIAEADSGGHTDNRPLPALLPIMLGLRDAFVAKYGYTRPIRIGAAGGIGTPGSVASAFSMGAAFVLTGSVNQSALEAGLAPSGKTMLAQADMADVAMAPSPDMFELGVKVQVLRRGTMFAQRAAELYEVYQAHDSLEALPAPLRANLEDRIFRMPLDAVWEETRQFWQRRNPEELARAEADGRHRMALCFRWYVGRSSRWAIGGDADRRLDYQIWCGPAMGAFNRWVAGSFLEPPEARGVVQIARNLLEGAAVISRAHQLRSFGVPMPNAAFAFAPRPLA
ncbi:MAG: PfaD family polyunsaturated fatty acid/polyketide biosynthesis protein [Myxococcota bacterium]